MVTKPQITFAEIRNRATDKSFARGENYYHNGAIFNTIRRDNVIEAQCEGSYPQPYRTSAEFDSSKLISTRCNCEYDWGGDCKHIVALLLTYLHEPEKFEEREPLQSTLASRSKEDLIDIIGQMLARYPDLQSIIERPTKNEIEKGTATVDFESIRKRVRKALNTYYDYDEYRYDYDTHIEMPHGTIYENSQLATRFLDNGDYKTALAIYLIILEEFAATDEYYYDEDGELAMLIDEVVEQIPVCLDQPDIINNDNERKAALNALLGVYIWDIDVGGMDVGISATDYIQQYCRPEDIPEIRQQIERAKARKANSRYGSWGIEAYDGFLMELDVLDNVDPEVTLQRLRDEGMFHLLISKLLELDRIDEATTIVQDKFINSHELIKSFYILETHGQLSLAIKLAETQLEQTFDAHIIDWLINQYEVLENHEKILHWRLVLMRHSPNDYVYKNIKSIAQKLNQWDSVRPQIIDNLKTRKAFDVLLLAYTHDEEWELAWETLPRVDNKYRSIHGLEFQLAEASRHAMPERAIPVYIKYAKQLINYRGRENYRQAAALLSVVQQMFDQLDECEKWEALIENIRSEFKRLPALQDELNRAGL